jgi:flagellar biosynthesis protein FliQ
MKIFNIVFAVLFLGFAALQYNDPDPFVWIAIYLAMVVACLLAAKNLHYKMLTFILALIYIIYAAILSPAWLTWWQSGDRALLFDDLAKMQFPYIEETREFLGLMICLAVLAVNYFYFERKANPKIL